MSTLAEGMTPPQVDEVPDPDDSSYQPYSSDPSSNVPPVFDSPTGYPQSLSVDFAEQSSSLRGYTDGFLTAKIFSLYSLSKLGFVGQYVADSLAKLGPDAIASGTAGSYKSGFLKGLADGEVVVSASLGIPHD
jgi:glucan 1,3-beta-glucosidase